MDVVRSGVNVSWDTVIIMTVAVIEFSARTETNVFQNGWLQNVKLPPVLQFLQPRVTPALTQIVNRMECSQKVFVCLLIVNVGMGMVGLRIAWNL